MPSMVSRDRDNGQFARRYHCDSCVMLSINGRPCHERGCPDAWQDATRKCKWCGIAFRPKSRRQEFCDDGCAESYCS